MGRAPNSEPRRILRTVYKPWSLTSSPRRTSCGSCWRRVNAKGSPSEWGGGLSTLGVGADRRHRPQACRPSPPWRTATAVNAGAMPESTQAPITSLRVAIDGVKKYPPPVGMTQSLSISIVASNVSLFCLRRNVHRRLRLWPGSAFCPTMRS